MLHKLIKLAGVVGLGTLMGCAAMKDRCPEDPFDPNASGFCRLLYSKEDQQKRLDQETAEGEALEERGEELKTEEGLSVTEFKKARAAAAELRAELAEQEGRATEAEARVKALQASGERDAAELTDINIQLAKVQALLKNVNETTGSSPEDVGKLQVIKMELEKELDSLLDM